MLALLRRLQFAIVDVDTPRRDGNCSVFEEVRAGALSQAWRVCVMGLDASLRSGPWRTCWTQTAGT